MGVAAALSARVAACTRAPKDARTWRSLPNKSGEGGLHRPARGEGAARGGTCKWGQSSKRWCVKYQAPVQSTVQQTHTV
eukprot:6128320-Pyramimonas_sp.AAC.1